MPVAISTLRFERSRDTELIREILTRRRLAYAQMKSDAAPSIQQFRVVLPANVVAVVVYQEEESAGIILLDLRAPVTAQIHFCFLPSTWGHATEIWNEALRWIWETTSLNLLVAPCPSHNMLARRVMLAIGFKDFAVEENVGTKHGKPFSLLMMKLERPR